MAAGKVPASMSYNNPLIKKVKDGKGIHGRYIKI